MILIGNLIFATSMLFTAIVLLWIVANCMIDAKKIIILLPFFFSGLLLCISAVLSYYGFFDQKLWFILELTWAVLFFLMFIVIRRKNDRN